MTAQTLINQIDRLINAQYAALDRATRANLISVRKSVLAGAKSMWDKAAVTPFLSEETGVMTYVSRSEAFKYGRFEKLTEDVKGAVRVGAVTDIRNLEANGKRVYELQYNGYAWVYNQGYGLPVTSGVKVPLVAQAVYSDFYGNRFDALLRKHWERYADDILSTVRRDLNQGKSYFQLAKDIQKTTDQQYNRVLTVARTEAHRIQSMSYVDSLGLLDEVGAEYGQMWVATIDDKTRDDHREMDGQMADKNGIFHLPSGASGPAPGLTGNAADDINDRCTAVVIIDGQKPTERRIRGEGIVPFETFSQRLKDNGNIPLSALRKAR